MLETISAHVYKHWKILSRRPGEFAWILVYPFIGVLSIGIFAAFLITQGAPLSSLMFVFIGVQVWNFYDISQRAITYGVTFDVWGRALRHAFTAKSSTKDFIIGNSAFGLVTSVVAYVLVGLLGIAAFGFNCFGFGIFFLNLFFVFLFATGVGLVIDSLILTRGEKYISLIFSITGVIMIFSGVYYPASVLPGYLQPLAYALPSTYAIDSMRAAMTPDFGLALSEMALGAVASLVYLAAGVLAFRAGLTRGRRSGMINKY